MKKFIIRMISLAMLTLVAYPLLAVIVSYWMASGGWKYADHKVFFYFWTISPIIISWFLVIVEDNNGSSNDKK